MQIREEYGNSCCPIIPTGGGAAATIGLIILYVV